MKRILLLLTVMLALSTAAFAAGRCDNCRMKVPDDSGYKVVLTLKSGETKVVCSIFCASMMAEAPGAEAVKMAVADYITGEEIDARSATWVEGSDARAVMSEESRIAFKDAGSAEAFVKEHGGHISSFDEVYKDSVAEWKKK